MVLEPTEILTISMAAPNFEEHQVPMVEYCVGENTSIEKIWGHVQGTFAVPGLVLKLGACATPVTSAILVIIAAIGVATVPSNAASAEFT